MLQTLLLTYGGPGRRALMFEPTYALHAHIARDHRHRGRRRASGGPTSPIDPDAAVALDRASTRPSIVFVCSPNNPTGTVEPRETVERLLAAAADDRRVLVVDEAYGEFAPWSALELVDDDRPLVVVRTYSKVWSLAAVRLGFAVAPAWVIAELEKVVLPYHLSVPTQLAGTIALDFRAEMEQRVAVARRGARPAVRRARRARRASTVVPVGRELPAVPRRRRRARSLAAAARRAACSCATSRRGRGVEDCLRVTVGTPDENDAFLAALGEALPEVVDDEPRRRPSCSRETKETTVDARRSSSTARARRRSRPASRSSTTCSSSSASTRGFDLTIEANGDLDVDLHHTVEDVGIVLGNALREALGDKRGVRRFANALVPLDEALVQVALDLSGRPFLVYDVDPVVGVDRHVRPAARRGVLEGLRRRRAASRCTSAAVSGKNGHHVIEASFKGVARALRDAVKVEGDDVPSTKGTLVGLTLMIAVVDYGIGNLRSAEKALQHLGADARLTADAGEIERGRRGRAARRRHFGACMRALRDSGLEAVTSAAATDGRPFLGICVGMQMLFDGSDESPDVAGLGIVAGPHHPAARHGAAPADGLEHARVATGLAARRRACPIPRGCYFVHTFAPEPDDDGVVAAWCDYGRRFAAAVERGPVWATQFHPEKSGRRRAALLAQLRRRRPPHDAMELYPVDRSARRAGRAPAARRLRRARPSTTTIPVAVARRFDDAGARWIHVVDLDAARDGGDAEPRRDRGDLRQRRRARADRRRRALGRRRERTVRGRRARAS